MICGPGDKRKIERQREEMKMKRDVLSQVRKRFDEPQKINKMKKLMIVLPICDWKELRIKVLPNSHQTIPSNFPQSENKC